MLCFLEIFANSFKFPCVVPEGLLGEFKIKSLLTDLRLSQVLSSSLGSRCQLVSAVVLIQ